MCLGLSIHHYEFIITFNSKIYYLFDLYLYKVHKYLTSLIIEYKNKSRMLKYSRMFKIFSIP